MTNALTVAAADDVWSAVGAAATGVLGVQRVTTSPAVRVLPADHRMAPEEHVIHVDADAAVIQAGSAAGVFRALTRIRREGRVRPVHDAPAHAWRGFMLDVARWFVPVDELLVLIDQLAERRLNVLHLHLTDDQGWRIPIPRWPRLTDVGAWRDGTSARPIPVEGAPDPRLHDDWGHGHVHDGRPHGGHYTRAELERVVSYAADRFISVVPEIDLPGHTQAAIAAYPQLGAGAPDLPVATRFGLGPALLAPTQEVVDFLSDVFDEVCDIFPGSHVHVGGDEPRLATWRDDPVSRARARALGLPGTDALRRWFVQTAVELLRSRDRTALYWYDGELLSDEAIAVSWLADDGGLDAAVQGARVVAADHTRTYLNYFSRAGDPNPHACGIVLDEAAAAGFRVTPKRATGAVAARFLGGQAHLWTEYAPHRCARESLIFPRLDLIAAALWDGPGGSRAVL